MRPKPKHLGPEYASVFQDDSVVDAYPYRPPYPSEAIKLLAGLAVDVPRRVLDIGCGTGDIARPLAPFVGSSPESSVKASPAATVSYWRRVHL